MEPFDGPSVEVQRVDWLSAESIVVEECAAAGEEYGVCWIFSVG